MVNVPRKYDKILFIVLWKVAYLRWGQITEYNHWSIRIILMMLSACDIYTCFFNKFLFDKSIVCKKNPTTLAVIYIVVDSQGDQCSPVFIPPAINHVDCIRMRNSLTEILEELKLRRVWNRLCLPDLPSVTGIWNLIFLK